MSQANAPMQSFWQNHFNPRETTMPPVAYGRAMDSCAEFIFEGYLSGHFCQILLYII